MVALKIKSNVEEKQYLFRTDNNVDESLPTYMTVKGF
jgi:hypothetical protein